MFRKEPVDVKKMPGEFKLFWYNTQRFFRGCGEGIHNVFDQSFGRLVRLFSSGTKQKKKKKKHSLKG
jgi:hypothetical protein